MGRAKTNRQLFSKTHPYCIFCGGARLATTIEHCPPRAFFRNRQWPDGFEFPSCNSCNHGTSNEDQIIAMIARFTPLDGDELHYRESVKYMTGVYNNNPGLFDEMMPTNIEARRINRELGVIPKQGQLHQDIAGVKVVPKIHEAVGVFAAKLSKGIFYLEIKKVFPANGCLAMRWFTNAEVYRDGEAKIFRFLESVSGSAPVLRRSRSELNDQFSYKFCAGEADKLIVLDARIGNAFRILILGCTVPGRLESILNEDTDVHASDAKFAILQP